jgi:hypothetical protein
MSKIKTNKVNIAQIGVGYWAPNLLRKPGREQKLMSGIVGIWNLNGSPVNKLELDHFTDALAHRGPDGMGTYIDPDLEPCLGHRRLSILDLMDSGHQPMSYGNKRYWMR